MRLDSIDRTARIEAQARRMRAQFIDDLVSRLLRRAPRDAVAGTRAA